MSRYVKTVAAADGSGGGSAGDSGISAAQACQYACKAICDMFCTNLICPECRPYYNTLPVPTVNDYVVVCHCDCWTNSFGQGMVFCLDTNKYRGFKWCYRGVRLKGCCWWYGNMGMAAKGVDCFCCCTNSYRYAKDQWCSWPLSMCCSYCWNYYNHSAISIGCQQCCTSQCDGNFNFGWEIYPQWQHALQNYNRVQGQVGYCIWMPKGNRDMLQCAGGHEVTIGTNSHCHWAITWSCNEACKGTTCYLDRWCVCVNSPGFESAFCGIWECNCMNGKDSNANWLPFGVTPSWTMWGIPCCYPMNIGSYSGGTGLTCCGNLPSFSPNEDWVQPTS